MPLKIARHIQTLGWMKTPEIRRLFTVLQGRIDADEPQALLVGGCVRNALLKVEVEDVDIATPLMPEDVMEILRKEDISVIPTGLQHGTVMAVMGDVKYEITTLRHDKETDGRHAVVSFTQSWSEDAVRRDFTMNTLLMDLKGNVYDPLEQGIADLDKCLVRFAGQAQKRIEEDHLRILRFFRFSALYGDGYDDEGLQACRAMAGSIEKLSKERVTQEYFKIITSQKPYDVMKVMFENNVLNDFKFEAYDTEFFEHFCTFQSRYMLTSLSSRLYVSAGLDMANIAAMKKFILFPKVLIKDMKMIEGVLTLSDLSCEQAVKVALYKFGRVATAQALMIELVQDRVMNGYAPQALDVIQNWDIPTFPVSGDDLMAKGVPRGPELGEELRRLEDEWVEGGFKAI